MDLNKLSIREKIGQRFIFGINDNNIDVIIDLIKNYSIGGVILYKKNYSNYDEMLSVIKRLKESNKNNKIPLFIAIDQEGGRVNRMPFEIKNINSVYDLSKVSEGLLYDSGLITGKMLKQMGINMNFAPVMDIYDNKSKVLYKRCFCGNGDDVYRYGIKYVEGLYNNDIISVVKHFPGHGATKMDSHFITPYVYDYKKVLDEHIVPFDKALKNEMVDAVMVNHMVVRNMTGGFPASISNKFIKEYIRDRNSFSGLVITDDINMLSRNIIYKFSYLKKAFFSGSDIILVKVRKDAGKIIDKCIKMIDNNKDYIDTLNDSVDRIIKIKEKYNITDDISYDGININEINREIDKINKKCDRVNTK